MTKQHDMPVCPVCTFDSGAEVFEAMVAGADAGLDPKAAERAFDRLRLGAAIYLAKHKDSTPNDLNLAKDAIRAISEKRKKRER